MRIGGEPRRLASRIERVIAYDETMTFMFSTNIGAALDRELNKKERRRLTAAHVLRPSEAGVALYVRLFVWLWRDARLNPAT